MKCGVVIPFLSVFREQKVDVARLYGSWQGL